MPASPWSACCRAMRPRQRPRPRSGAAAHRRIILDGAAAAVPVHRFEALAPDQAVAGPAIVESETTTILLPPGCGPHGCARLAGDRGARQRLMASGSMQPAGGGYPVRSPGATAARTAGAAPGQRP